MKAIFKSALALVLMLVTAPALSAVIVEPEAESTTALIFAEASAMPFDNATSVVQISESRTTNTPVTIFRNTIASHVLMLPAPSDWLMLLTGFGVIGYAMRSRKRGRVSFN